MILTGTTKSALKQLKAETRLTNYSNKVLKKNLNDCDAVVSTLRGPSELYMSTHSTILAACREPPRCKHFIPSEWNINFEDFPDQPMFSSAIHEFIGYILPQGQNPLREVGLAWAMKHGTKVFDIYGDGLQKVILTSLGDGDRAVLAVLRNSITTGSGLPPVTHLAWGTLTYLDLYELIRSLDPVWKSNTVTFSEVLDVIYKGLQANDDGVAVHQMRILGFTNANHIPEKKGNWSPLGLHAISAEELLEKAKASW